MLAAPHREAALGIRRSNTGLSYEDLTKELLSEEALRCMDKDPNCSGTAKTCPARMPQDKSDRCNRCNRPKKFCPRSHHMAHCLAHLPTSTTPSTDKADTEIPRVQTSNLTFETLSFVEYTGTTAPLVDDSAHLNLTALCDTTRL
ncbi:hypothetical protein Pmar_PMAR024719 [Perkinsus marinus ATCC 50983]|uniref:Uncharacterized protein n=1 Tax=Perkinsus marinus (strain ATCC 50983 / TXsc) TaxID=423536 RepID=C5M147_PERM5|nr:hypothetical protein Pmar_PMAR024719 [Perkinsus marinus ATCC 50983]EEQ97277.1 hypothetical protein Pmar_PMAR024719 [Perkinsus marinus ATCC 50983]|eukprot:XP_002764560.1 hypothetical protein Pmar_PMAR024719 [Perkinsus marinus ATCC 50983]